MDNDLFLGSSIQPQTHFELSSSCFFSPNYESSMDQFSQMESKLSSIVSSSPVSVSKEKLPNLGNLIGNYPPVISGDPGFAERAAKFSCFGSRSFNGRTMLNNGGQLGDYNNRVSPLMGNNNNVQKMNKVLSSPSLQMSEKNYNLGKKIVDIRPNQNSRVSSMVPEFNSKKRKAISRGKCQETKVTVETKRHKDNEGDGSENGSGKTEVKKHGNCNRNVAKKDEEKANTKSSEPPKDYIHVRARRGQATDSHSLAERVRREKISKRMKLLQDLVPGCNKVTGKALMLDEIINYVQTLQRQVEFLSMKLATVNPRLDFNMDNLFPKDGVNGSMGHQIDTSASIGLFGQHNQKLTEVQNNFISNEVEPVHTIFRHTIGSQTSQLDEISNGLSQFQTLCEDDLQNIIQMGFSRDMGFNSRLSWIQ